MHEIVSMVIDDAISCNIISAKNEIKNVKNKSFIGYQQTASGQPLIWSGDTCSWKRKLERTRSWEVLSWNVRAEVGKFLAKLESER